MFSEDIKSVRPLSKPFLLSNILILCFSLWDHPQFVVFMGPSYSKYSGPRSPYSVVYTDLKRHSRIKRKKQRETEHYSFSLFLTSIKSFLCSKVRVNLITRLALLETLVKINCTLPSNREFIHALIHWVPL